jgi:hypothetical protein
MIEQRSASQSLEEFVGCAEWDRLLRQFIAATGDLIAIQVQSLGASCLGVEGVAPDPILRRAVIEKLRAKQALLQHLRNHRCGAPQWMAM